MAVGEERRKSARKLLVELEIEQPMFSLRVYELSFEGSGDKEFEGLAPAAGILPRSFGEKGIRPDIGEDVARAATVVVCVGVAIVW